MKIYVSSTYQDLIDHRAAVDRTLRRMGHDVIGMEQYVAEGTKPLARCQADVRIADLYVIIVGWRYGYLPAVQPPPGGFSITELEYRTAVDAGVPVLAFLLDPEAPWPPNRIDAMAGGVEAGGKVGQLRALLGANLLAGMFRTPDDLASQVAAAVSVQGLNRFMVERVLALTSVGSSDMGLFGEGQSISDSTLGSIKEMVAKAAATRALVVDLGQGDQWWSTRLYLLASLLQAATAVRQLVFRDANGRFVGMASPPAVVDRLAAVFPELAAFNVELRKGMASADTQRETGRQLELWNATMQRAGAPTERDLKVGVRADLILKWLGDRLVDRCIRVDSLGLSMTQVQQIVDSLVSDVPIERHRPPPNPPTPAIPPMQPIPSAGAKPVAAPAIPPELMVVDRDAFALELAREWVRTGIPRNPVR